MPTRGSRTPDPLVLQAGRVFTLRSGLSGLPKVARHAGVTGAAFRV